VNPAGRTPPRRSVTREILGRWVIAVALVPFALPVILLAGGHVTAAMLIWALAIMVIVALAHGHSTRR
jgi:hypothetical protein